MQIDLFLTLKPGTDKSHLWGSLGHQRSPLCCQTLIAPAALFARYVFIPPVPEGVKTKKRNEENKVTD